MIKKITYKPIGTIHSIYNNIEDMPKNERDSGVIEASLEIKPEFIEAMADLKVNEEYYVIFHFHKSEGYDLTVPIKGNGPMTGLFSTHAPRRPNPIGITKINIKRIEDNFIIFSGVDMIDGTPVLDIKNVN
ncbi:tRNA (N6-threonylcarbamoyladenosine(37)-N6)-methyltransferase TrmO [Methanosphaera sp.]